MNTETFEEMLTGGHPNSLGRTIEVVEIILSDPHKLEELYSCYFSSDEVVRLRTSSAMKRISCENTKSLTPYIDRFLNEVSKIDQASTQWTLALLFQTLAEYMSHEQKEIAQFILKKNLESHNDWIVLNNTMQTLAEWAKQDVNLRKWLIPHLEKLSIDKRRSVSGRAKKLHSALLLKI